MANKNNGEAFFDEVHPLILLLFLPIYTLNHLDLFLCHSIFHVTDQSTLLYQHLFGHVDQEVAEGSYVKFGGA